MTDTTTSVIPDYPGGPATTTPLYPTQNPFWFNQTLVPVDSLQKTHKPKAKQLLTCAAMDAVLPVPYGQVLLGGLVANAWFINGYWTFWVLWCEGELQSIDTLYVNDVAIDGVNVTSTNYTGTLTQTVNSNLVTAFASQSPTVTFTNTLPGVAYSVFKMAGKKAAQGIPKFTALVKGRKIYDPRLDSTNGGTGSQRLADSTTWAWSQNPSLILADFLKAPTNSYGAGYTLVWSTVITAANANDATVGVSPNTEKSRSCNIILDVPNNIAVWKDTLRTAANVYIAENQRVAKLVPDATASVAQAFDHDSGNIVSLSSVTMIDTTALPTVIDVTYTDTTTVPWSDNTVTVKRIGVDAGTTQFRRATVPMQWIQGQSQANREAIERLNKLWLRGITFTLEVFDEGLTAEIGDIITVNYPDAAFNTLPVRIVAATPTTNGTWQLKCELDNAAAYSTVVVAGPGSTTGLPPNPGTPPTPTNLTWVEELYLDNLGKVKSRMRATWDDNSSTYSYWQAYRVEVYNGTTLLVPPTVSYVPTFAFGPAQELVAYTVNVYTMSPVAVSSAATATQTAAGKTAVPTDIPFLGAYEAAGEVRLTWIPALDLNNPDTLFTEIRYGSPGCAWEAASLLDYVAYPGTSYATRSVVPGTYTFHVKGRDSLKTAAHPNGQESTNSASTTLVVAGDPNLYLAGTHTFTAGTLSNMAALTIDGTTTWVTEMGATMDSIFTGSTLAASYPNVMATYNGAGTSYLLSDVFDFGASISGLFSLSNNAYTDLSGTASLFMETSTDNVTYSQWPGTSATATARFLRIRLTTVGQMLITTIGSTKLLIAALQEQGNIVTSASVPVTVTLSRKYSAVQSIQVTADGSSGQANPAYMNVIISNDIRYMAADYMPEDYVDEAYNPTNSFDIKCWDGTNTQVSRTVQWLFRGI